MEECFDKEKAYRNYIEFCNRYKDFIEDTIEKMNNLLEEINDICYGVRMIQNYNNAKLLKAPKQGLL